MCHYWEGGKEGQLEYQFDELVDGIQRNVPLTQDALGLLVVEGVERDDVRDVGLIQHGNQLVVVAQHQSVSAGEAEGA